MKKKTGHPTREILLWAQSAPGGIIRWREANDIYLDESEAARRDRRNKRNNYHMSLKKVLKTHFEKVQGTDGFYVLKSRINNPNAIEDMNEMRQFHATYGSDQYGRSTVDIPYMGSLARKLRTKTPPYSGRSYF
jgi:hypothetical protein